MARRRRRTAEEAAPTPEAEAPEEQQEAAAEAAPEEVQEVEDKDAEIAKLRAKVEAMTDRERKRQERAELEAETVDMVLLRSAYLQLAGQDFPTFIPAGPGAHAPVTLSKYVKKAIQKYDKKSKRWKTEGFELVEREETQFLKFTDQPVPELIDVRPNLRTVAPGNVPFEELPT